MEKSPKPGASTPTGSPPWDSSWPRSVEGEELEAVWGYLEARFGVPPRVRTLYSLRERGGTYHALGAVGESSEAWASLKVVSAGLPLVRRVGSRVKPTSAALRLLSPWVSRNRVSLEEREAWALLRDGGIPWPQDASEGYVLVETEAGVLGCGLVLGGRLRSQLPRSEVAALDLS